MSGEEGFASTHSNAQNPGDLAGAYTLIERLPGSAMLWRAHRTRDEDNVVVIKLAWWFQTLANPGSMDVRDEWRDLVRDLRDNPVDGLAGVVEYVTAEEAHAQFGWQNSEQEQVDEEDPDPATIGEKRQDATQAHLVFEMGPFDSMHSVLQDGPLEEHDAIRTCLSIARSLESFHELGHYHNAVGLPTLLRTFDTGTILVDLGWPEEFPADRNALFDITSLGFVLGDLLTGRLLELDEKEEHKLAVKARIAWRRERARPRYPHLDRIKNEDLRSLVRSMTDGDVVDSIQAMIDVRVALEKVDPDALAPPLEPLFVRPDVSMLRLPPGEIGEVVFTMPGDGPEPEVWIDGDRVAPPDWIALSDVEMGPSGDRIVTMTVSPGAGLEEMDLRVRVGARRPGEGNEKDETVETDWLKLRIQPDGVRGFMANFRRYRALNPIFIAFVGFVVVAIASVAGFYAWQVDKVVSTSLTRSIDVALLQVGYGYRITVSGSSQDGVLFPTGMVTNQITASDGEKGFVGLDLPTELATDDVLYEHYIWCRKVGKATVDYSFGWGPFARSLATATVDCVETIIPSPPPVVELVVDLASQSGVLKWANPSASVRDALMVAPQVDWYLSSDDNGLILGALSTFQSASGVIEALIQCDESGTGTTTLTGKIEGRVVATASVECTLDPAKPIQLLQVASDSDSDSDSSQPSP